MNPLKYQMLGLAIYFHLGVSYPSSDLLGQDPGDLNLPPGFEAASRWSSVHKARTTSRKAEESNRSCHDCRICGQVLLLFQTTKHNTKYFFPLYAPTCGHPIFQQCPKGRGGIRFSETMPRGPTKRCCDGILTWSSPFPQKNKTNSDTGIILENRFMNKRHWVYKYIITLYIYLKTCLPTPSMLWFNFYNRKSGFIGFYASINLNWVVHLSFSEDLDR